MDVCPCLEIARYFLKNNIHNAIISSVSSIPLEVNCTGQFHNYPWSVQAAPWKGIIIACLECTMIHKARM